MNDEIRSQVAQAMRQWNLIGSGEPVGGPTEMEGGSRIAVATISNE